MSEINIRKVQKKDLSRVLEMNEDALPHVNSIPISEFENFTDITSFFVVAEVKNELAGFLIALSPGEEYDSENYRYFTEHYEQFDYVDRIVIDRKFRGQGLGKALYFFLKENTVQGRITCEVNIEPPNPKSMEFHTKIGFREVAQQHSEAGKKWVSLMVWE